MADRPLPKWLVVARREFLERVRTIWFLLVTVLGPLGMAAMIIIPAWLAHKSADEKVRVELVDRSVDASGKPANVGVIIVQLTKDMRSNVQIVLVPSSTTTESLLGKVRRKHITGFMEIPRDVLGEGEVVYRGDNVTNLAVMAALRQIASLAVRSKQHNVDTKRVLALLTPVPFSEKDPAGKSGTAKFILGYAVMFILYMSIILYGVTVSRSVASEKSSRIMEILVSTVKPRSLMLGKILGVGSVGLFQLSIWASMGFLLLTYRMQLLGALGVSGGDFAIPGVSFGTVAVMIGYFIVGYFFYASIYAAIGAMVNSEQEAQQAQTPIVILLIIPVLCVQLVANDPSGGAAEVLTLIPFSSPVLMPMRYLLGGATVGQVAVSMLVLLASTAFAVWLAARIYRVGILMYGKRPSLRELARWIRHS